MWIISVRIRDIPYQNTLLESGALFEQIHQVIDIAGFYPLYVSSNEELKSDILIQVMHILYLRRNLSQLFDLSPGLIHPAFLLQAGYQQQNWDPCCQTYQLLSFNVKEQFCQQIAVQDIEIEKLHIVYFLFYA